MTFSLQTLGPQTFHYVHHTPGVKRNELERPESLKGRPYAIELETTRQPTIDLDGKLLGYAAVHPSVPFFRGDKDEFYSKPNYAGPMISTWGSGIFAQGIACNITGTLASYGYIHVANGDVKLDLPDYFNFDELKIYASNGVEVNGGSLKYSKRRVPVLTDATIGKYRISTDHDLGLTIPANKQILLREMVKERWLAIVCSAGKVTINRTEWP